MPRVAADEKIVLVLAKSSRLHQLLLLLHVGPAKELGSEHLGAHSAQPAQSQSTPWHQAANPRVFPRTLQCPDKSFQSRLFEPFEHRAGDRSSFSVVVITRLKPPQPFHQSAASRSENEHGWLLQGGWPCPRRPLAPSQSGAQPVTDAGNESVTEFGLAELAWCSPTVACSSLQLHTRGRTLSRSNLMLQRQLSRPRQRLLICLQVKFPPLAQQPVKVLSVGVTPGVVSAERNCAASVAAAGR